MSVVKVTPARQTDVFISEEPIGHLAVVYLSAGRAVKEGTSTTQHLVAGVNIGGALSGKPVRVVGAGIVSGVICAASVAVGDRLTCANVTSGGGLASGAGKVTPLNNVRVSGSILLASGLMTNTSGLISGHVGVQGLSLINPGGLISGITGFLGESFNVGRIVGKALDAGNMGSGIRMLVGIGG